MPFKKGKSGNPNGRKAGTPNRVTGDLRERITELLESQFEQVAADLAGLEPKDRVNAWLKLAEFALPKLQRSEVSAEITPTADTLEKTVINIAFRQPTETKKNSEK